MSHQTSLEKRTARIWAVSIMCGFFMVFSGIIVAYVYKFDQELMAENRAHLSKVSNYIVAHMTTVVDDTQKSLQAVSSAVAALDSSKERMAYLDIITEQFAFAYMGYANQNGMLQSTVPSEAVNVSDENYFKAALQGKSTVSDQLRKIFDNHAVSGILLAVPMYKDGQAGVLVAMLETKSLLDVLGRESFDGNGYSYIIDTTGAVIMRTKSLDFGNLFTAWKGLRFLDNSSLSSFMTNVAKGRSGLSKLRNAAGDKLYVYYQSLPFNNWTVVNVVPEQAVSAKTIALTRQLAIIGGATVLVFMGLMLWAMRSYKASQESKLAADAKSAFLANMSHEIRTPMNAIVGISEILLRDDMSAKHRGQVTNILNSGKGLLTIINDILDISKIEAGKLIIVNEPYELESLLHDLSIIVALRIGEKPVRFLIEPDLHLPRQLVGDMGRIKQVLLNIVNNAIKFTQVGYIRLVLRAEQNEHGWLLHMEVHDTGIGIKKEDLGKMFVRFSQVDTKRNRSIEGTGLGLTISQKLCEMMGGHIEAQSEYGKGSVFSLTFRQEVPHPDPMIRLPARRDISLLLYEQDSILLDFITSYITRMKLSCKVCHTVECFAHELQTGNFSHALAPRALLRRFYDKKSTTQLLGLLPLSEHSFMDMEGANIYLPLFSIQLSHVLNGTQKGFCSGKQASVDMDVIEPLPHISVLIVDDNELNIMVAEGLLAPYCMHIDHVLSGMDAILAVQNHEYDLVLMDHMMPGMDGVEATQCIRDLPDEKYQKLLIVALTANTTREAREMFMGKSFNGFLSKPIETSKMHQMLKAFFKEINNTRALQKSSNDSKKNQESV